MLGRMAQRRVEHRSVTSGDIIAAINERRSGSKGPVVDSDSAMRLSAVWACVRLIAGVGSTLPLDVQRGSDTVSSSLFTQPDPSMSATSWRYQLWSSLLTDGNGYGLITGVGANGWPSTVEILDPATVTWSTKESGWETRVNGQLVDRWPNGPLWHVPLFLTPGCPYGMSPIMAAKQSISTGLSAEQYGSEFFTGGAHPSSIVSADVPGLTQEQATAIKQSVLSATSGREPAVLGSDLSYQQIQTSPEESQFLDTQRFGVEQIARIYGVFPEMIGGATSGSNVTYANREQRAADWLTFGFVPYLIPIEEGFTSLLPRPQRVRHNVDGLLRSDLKSRYESYEIASRIAKNMGTPLLLVDEMRGFEDLPPVPGGDVYEPPEPPHTPDPMADPADPQGGQP